MAVVVGGGVSVGAGVDVWGAGVIVGGQVGQTGQGVAGVGDIDAAGETTGTGELVEQLTRMI